jgi:uncharacterized protein (TIRG00374 family)
MESQALKESIPLLLRRKRFWLGFIITAVCLAVFLARTDFGQIQEAFAEADYVLAFAAIPLYFVGFWVRTMRWKILLRPIADVPVRRLFPVVIIGLMTNNVAPARVGELVRAYLVGEREQISKSTALGTIAVDRALDGLTLVAILGIVAVASGANAELKSIGAGTAVLFVAAATVLVSLAFSPRWARNMLLAIIRRMPAGLAVRAEALLDSFLSGLIALRSPLSMGMATVLSFSSWLIEGTMYWVVGEAFNLGIGFDVYLLVLAGANLALSILASPGGVGPFEVTTREVLVYFGVGSAMASAYALALHALLLGPVILAGFILLWSTHLSLSQLLGVPQQPAPAGGGIQPAPVAE